jgi:hypothetical protein
MFCATELLVIGARTRQSVAVERLSDEQIEQRFGPPIYVLANREHSSGWGWGGMGSSADAEVSEVSIRHNAGGWGEIIVATQRQPSNERQLLVRLVVGAEPVFPMTIDETTTTIRFGEEAVVARTIRITEEHWIATAQAGSRWVEISGFGVSSEGLELATLDTSGSGRTDA